jgi:hypothetical protein
MPLRLRAWNEHATLTLFQHSCLIRAIVFDAFVCEQAELRPAARSLPLRYSLSRLLLHISAPGGDHIAAAWRNSCSHLEQGAAQHADASHVVQHLQVTVTGEETGFQ